MLHIDPLLLRSSLRLALAIVALLLLASWFPSTSAPPLPGRRIESLAESLGRRTPASVARPQPPATARR